MSSESPPRRTWEDLLGDKDVVVLTKATFFSTVNLLFRYAESPERCTWEFFHYRGYEYILGTWCATFNIEGFVISCGAQHPFIYYLKRGMHYVLPDYVLLSHRRDANGEQEDHVILVVEIKALGRVEPDTQAGRETAENIFQKTWTQRENQARLAFRSHPSQQTVNIVMAAGPWFALYIFERSQLIRSETVNKGRLLRDSQPAKRRRRVEDIGFVDRDDAEVLQVSGAGTEDASLDGGKRKREANTSRRTAPVVNHVFQLGPSGERDALNPWFLRMLVQMRLNLENSLGKFKTQNSWFDWPIEVKPTGDGHAEGFTLPTTTRDPVPDVEVIDVGHIIRLDDDPTIGGLSVPSTPGSSRETLNMLEANALLSPTMHRTRRTFRGNIDNPSTHSYFGFGPPPFVDSDQGTDDDTTPKGQRIRQPQGASDFRRGDRELSPSAAYLERRQHGPSQFHSALPDSSPLHFTPQRLSWPRTDDESDSESSAGYRAGTPDPGPMAIPRPASAPPTSSSPPSRTSQNTPTAHSVSRVPEPPSRANDRSLPERVIRPIPSARTTVPYQPLGALKKGPYLVRPPAHTTSDRKFATTQREIATPEEWACRPPNADELLMHALRGDRGPDGVRDYVQGYRRAGMNKEQAIRARDEYLKHSGRSRTQARRKDPPGGPSVASGSGGANPTATAGVPPVLSHRPAIHASTSAGISGGNSSYRTPSSVTTAPSTAQAATRASSSHPSPVDGVPVAQTKSFDGSDFESPDDDLTDDEVQVSMLAERLRNLSVTDTPQGTAGNPRWDNPSPGTILVFAELARKAKTDLRKVFRNAGMDERQVENAHAVYRSQVRGKITIADLLVALLAEGDDVATTRRGIPAGARPAEGQRRTTARSEAPPQPGPSRIRGREEPSTRKTNPDPAMQDPNQGLGPLRANRNTNREGKEKQG